METVNGQDRTQEIASRIVSDMLRDTRLRRFALSVADNLVDGWAQGRPLKQKLTRPLRRMLARAVSGSATAKGRPLSADIGRLLTAWSARVNSEHGKDPSCHVQRRSETIGAFMDNTDFGEICEMVHGSEECVVGTVEAFNRHLWRYPAKVGSILASLLAAANTSIRALHELMRPIEKNVGPDLLADLTLSLLKGIRAKDAGGLSNSAMELLHRLHTGSLLLGRAGKPLFQTYLTDFLKGWASQIDPVLFGKARRALAENRESIGDALADAFQEHPELVLALVSTLGSTGNASVKPWAGRIRVLNAVDEASLSRAAGQAGSELDTFEISELVNGFFRLLNRLHGACPDLFASTARSVADSLDTTEIRQTLEWLIPEMLDAFRPVIAETVPVLVNGLCEMVSPDGGFESEGRDEALTRLRSVLNPPGGEV